MKKIGLTNAAKIIECMRTSGFSAVLADGREQRILKIIHDAEAKGYEVKSTGGCPGLEINGQAVVLKASLFRDVHIDELEKRIHELPKNKARAPEMVGRPIPMYEV